MPLLFAPVSACPGGGTLPAFASAASQQAAAARDEPAGEPGDEGAAVQRQRTDALLSALPNGVVMRALDGRLMPLTEWPALRAMALGHGLGSQLMGVLSPAGKLHWLMVNMELIRDAHALPAGTVACFTDVTEQRSQQALLSHVVEAAGVGTWERDMDADSMVCNDRLWRMLGYRRGDVGPTLSAWNHLVHPDSRADWAAALRDHLANPAVPCRAELRIRRPDGDWAAVLSCGVVIASAQDGTPRRMAGIHVAMTEQMQMQAMLRHAARTNGLTQLPNRAAVFDQVQQAIDRVVQQPAHQFAVVGDNFLGRRQEAGPDVVIVGGASRRQGPRWARRATLAGGLACSATMRSRYPRPLPITAYRRSRHAARPVAEPVACQHPAGSGFC